MDMEENNGLTNFKVLF